MNLYQKKLSAVFFAVTSAITFACAQTSIPLTNAGFESPASGKITGFDSATDVPGWSDLGVNADSGVENSTAWGTHSGSYAAFLMSGDAGTSQMSGYTIQDGDEFTVGFWANNIWDATQLTVTLVDDSSNVLGSYAATGFPANANTTYQYYETTISATAASIGNVLGIQFVNTGAGWVGLDDVTIAVGAVTPPAAPGSARPTATPIAIVDISGTWNFTPSGQAQTTIEVPGGGWLKQGFNTTEADYETTISIPNVAASQVTILEFGAVNYQADLYIDEVFIGTRTQSYTQASFDITNHVSPGNSYAIRVHVKGRNAFMVGGKSLVPVGAGWSSNLPEGIFRSAELKIYPQVYIADTFVRTSVENDELYYDVWLRNSSNAAADLTLSGVLSSWNGDAWSYPSLPPQVLTVPAGEETKISVGPISWGLGADSFWWPNVPYEQGFQAQLHNLHLSLDPTGGGATLHTTAARFGFRECTQGPDGQGNTCYFLNGIRVNFRGDSFQGVNYDSINYGGGVSDAYDTLPGFLPGANGWPKAVDNIQRLNYNVVRIHQEPCTPYMLDVCDEMGLMIIEETAIRGSNRDQDFILGHDNMVNHLIELFTRDRNHASIVRQSISNEPNNEPTDSTQFQVDLYDAAMALDGTRPLSIDCDKASNFYESMNYANFSVYAHYEGGAAFGQYTEAVYARPDRPYGQGEFIWPADSSKQGFAWFATSTQAMRAQGASEIRPYTLLSSWVSVIPGVNTTDVTLEQGGNPVYGENNLPDPWANEQIQRIQAGFNPVLVADEEYWDALKTSNAAGEWPATIPFLTPSQSVTRTLNIYNDTFSGTSVDVTWELRVGSPTGTIADSGVVNATVPLGYIHSENISFTIPYVPNGTSLYLVLSSEKDGVELFREEDQQFQVLNTTELSGTAFGTAPSWSVGTEFDKASDGDMGTFFDYSNANNGYTGIDLGAGNAAKISYIIFTPRSGFEARMVGGEFQGSNTGENAGYTTIYTIGAQPTGTTTVEVNTTTAYRYLRYVGPVGSYCNIAEMQFLSEILDPATAWRLLNFGSPENTGSASDDADPDGDGVLNVWERASGGNPNAGEGALGPHVDRSSPDFSVIYSTANGASDIAFDVQECTSLASDLWTSAVGTNSVLDDDGIIQTNQFTVPVDAAAKFLRLVVTSP